MSQEQQAFCMLPCLSLYFSHSVILSLISKCSDELCERWFVGLAFIQLEKGIWEIGNGGLSYSCLLVNINGYRFVMNLHTLFRVSFHHRLQIEKESKSSYHNQTYIMLILRFVEGLFAKLSPR